MAIKPNFLYGAPRARAEGAPLLSGARLLSGASWTPTDWNQILLPLRTRHFKLSTSKQFPFSKMEIAYLSTT